MTDEEEHIELKREYKTDEYRVHKTFKLTPKQAESVLSNLLGAKGTFTQLLIRDVIEEKAEEIETEREKLDY